jgi:ABC-type multidrug transport system ATPase subunit
VADRVGILHGGRLVADLPTDELKRSVERRFVRARLPADEWRRRVPGLARIHEGPGGTELVTVAAGPETERALRSIDPDLAEAVPLTLEDVFLELTADDREGAEGLREHLERADVAR